MDCSDNNILCDFSLKVIHIRQVRQMNGYTSERLTHGDATLRLEAINSESESVQAQCCDDGT